MLSFKTGDFTIEVSDATANYADFLNEYDAIYIAPSAYQPTSVQFIKLIRFDDFLQENRVIKQVIVGATGGGTGLQKTGTLLDNDQLVTCCSDTVFSISIPDLNLLWQTKADWGTCFQLFKMKDDYIVHGEMEITRLNKQGNIVWQHSGADIFVTFDSSENFHIDGDYFL